MAGFTEGVLQKKLDDLNESQQSIQTLSLWLIHHRKHHQLVVKTWSKEMAKGSEQHKLTLMYLANDVIQNSKRKGPEYSREFVGALKKAFLLIGQSKTTPKTKQKLDRILQIWEERSVYDKKIVDEFKKLFNRNKTAAEPNNTDNNVDQQPPVKKQKTGENNVKVQREAIKPVKEAKEHKIKSRVTPLTADSLTDPPEVDELVKALTELENSASVDVAVREKISKLPPEVSEVKLLSKLEDKEQALKLAERVNEAVELLTAYNNRLSKEMTERRKVSQMLRDYTQTQKQLLQQAETRLEEYKEKLIKVEQVRHEILSHLSNLPDINKLSDLSTGLAPLPPAGDLFT